MSPPSNITLLICPAPANIIQVTVTYGTLVQTYIARYGNNNIYMLTNKGDASVSRVYEIYDVF
jgi:rhamnogalacturonan endolyase